MTGHRTRPRAWRWALVALSLALLVAGVFAAYRIVAITQADRWAGKDPAYALQWVARHPQALLALAEQHLAAGRTDAARATALHLLAVEPMEGRAFRVLAAGAVQRGEGARALSLYRTAARRSPRDTPTRVWLTNHYLLAGDYPAALQHVDYLLRTSPTHAVTLLPFLAQRAVDPAFAADLAAVLVQRPPWRKGLLSALQRGEDPRAADAVMAALRRAGGLSAPEFDDWIAYLLRQGRWGEAYSRWVGTVPLDGGALPLVYNDQFERPVSGRGFDWRVTRIPGVSVQFVPDPGARGLVAHAVFRGRAVAQVNLEQPLLLAPGRYRLSARVRADALRSDRGLEWSVACAGQGQPLATSERMQGSFGWRSVAMDLTVPATDCPAQWLRLRNPAPSGLAQQVWGDLWFDDVSLQPQS